MTRKNWMLSGLAFMIVALTCLTTGCKKDIKSDFSYDVSNTNHCLVKFTNLSVNYNSSQWDFGDGSTANTQDADHQFAQEGTYRVTLKVYGDEHNDMATKEIYVY